MMMDQLVINLNYFKIIKSIGNGNFGRVFLVQNTITNVEYAAKVSIQEFWSEDLQKSFINEITSYPKVKYPSILSLFGFNLLNFDKKPFPTIITEYMPNGSLDIMLDKEYHSLAPHQFSNSKKYIILLGIALGMNFLHNQKIIHRDLKPQNILLDDKYYPHICDFGLSVFSELQMPDIVMQSGVGTPLYMAPEILSDKPYTYKVDVYAFSLIAYELISGKPPFEHYTSIFRLQQEVQQGKRPDLTYIFDEDIRLFLQKCWSSNPTERPTFNEIVEEILTDRYKQAFSANDEEIEEYLDLYNDDQNLYSNDYLNIQKEADQGDIKSMVKFGLMLLKGEKVISDSKEAARYLKMASELGDKEAMFHYGMMLHGGEGIPRNKREASRLLKMSADLGESKSMYHYGLILEKGDGVQLNKKEAARYIKMSADLGETIAMLKYGNMLYDGKGIKSNKKEASIYYKMSADQGNITAMENYANMLYSGKGIEKNKKEAARYFKMASDQNDTNSMYSYGMMLYYGDGIEENKKLAFNYFKKSADKGNTNAMLNIAVMLLNDDQNDDQVDDVDDVDENGVCVGKKKMLIHYLKSAADNGNVIAMVKLAFLFRNGNFEGIQVNKKEALKYFKLAALNGNIEAIFNYAVMVDEGEGVDVDKKEAVKFFKMAASKGSTDAMFRYAVMLHSGDGVAVNKREAARFFKMAANKGDSNAMYNYGMMLRNGDGIAANRREADRYLNMAALQGNAIAIAGLLNPTMMQ